LRIRYGKEQDGKLIKKAVVYTQDEHRINFSDVDRDAVFVTSRLRSSGFETYIVGGAVRDLILGRKPKDFDIVTQATPAKIKKIFHNSRIIGRRFRLVHVYFGSKIFEVSTFRSLRDGHTSNTYGTIEEDVLRRDFSFNALFYDPEKQVVVDYVGGMEDIRGKKVNPVIPPELIFKDDPVRMIRALKYAAATGFSISWSLSRRIKKESSLLASISPSRLTEELFKIIHSPYASVIVERLEKSGLYVYLQPEASGRMKMSPPYRTAYIRGFKTGGDIPGGPVASLIRNYLAEMPWQDLQKGGWEEYTTVFFAARHFVLPMNPPRTELDLAVRLVFAEQGIELKKARFFDREHGRAAKAPAQRNPPGQESDPAGAPGRRRRRRRARKPPEAMLDP
jgi:poly(A) polymerase